VRALGEKFINENYHSENSVATADPPEEIADAICFMISNAAVSGSLWADAGWAPSPITGATKAWESSAV